MAGYISDFDVNHPWNVAMLPVTYDQDHWNEFVKSGKDPDGNIAKDAGGRPQIQVYPSIKYKGNFGGLSLNDDHVGNSTMVDWIHNGLKKQDIATLQERNLMPLSKHDPNSWDWNGENGFKSSMVQTVNEYTGKIFLLPLFRAKSKGAVTTQVAPAGWQQPGLGLAAHSRLSLNGVQLASMNPDLGSLLRQTAVQGQANNGNGNGNGKKKANGKNDTPTTPPPVPPPDVPPDVPPEEYQAGVGQGSNFYFNIVEFVGVKIMPATQDNREVILQPAGFLEPFGTFTQLQPAGTHATLVTTFATPKLSR
jgi:hypothetical protein